MHFGERQKLVMGVRPVGKAGSWPGSGSVSRVTRECMAGTFGSGPRRAILALLGRSRETRGGAGLGRGAGKRVEEADWDADRKAELQTRQCSRPIYDFALDAHNECIMIYLIKQNRKSSRVGRGEERSPHDWGNVSKVGGSLDLEFAPSPTCTCGSFPPKSQLPASGARYRRVP